MVQRDTPWPAGTPCWVDLGTEFYRDVFGYSYDDMSGGGFKYATFKTTGDGLGNVMRPPWDTPYGRMATLTDDQGAVFSIMAMAQAAGQ